MLIKFYKSVDDIAFCIAKTSDGEIKYLAMSNYSPTLINPAETLPGKASEISKEEFLKIANPDAVGIAERLFK